MNYNKINKLASIFVKKSEDYESPEQSEDWEYPEGWVPPQYSKVTPEVSAKADAIKSAEEAKMNAELEEKFLSELQMARKPERKNSLYLRRLRADFKDEFVDPPQHSPDLMEIITQSEVMSKALEWANRKTEPLMQQIDLLRGATSQEEANLIAEQISYG